MPKIVKIRFTSTLFTLSVILLLLIGITAIYSTTYSSASNSVLYKQLQWVLLGLVAAASIALVPTDFLSKYSKYMLAAVLVPLAYLTVASLCILFLSKATGAQPASLSKFFPFVVYNKGAARWLHLAGFTMQPSEFAKFTIILFLATYYGTRDTIKIESFKEGFLIPALASAAVMALVFLGKSLSNTIILASIVEKETAVEAERPRVAGVYANRLARGMLLQADPTVIYGLGQNFSGRLLYKHLDDAANPYNTYQRPGLTPGPIFSFGASALGAAVKPETHGYLYFVARPDGSGAHVFSTSLDAHNRAVREYREKRRGEKR